MSDLDYAKFCFIPDEKEVFVIAEITLRDVAKRELMVMVTKTRKILTIKYDSAVPIGSMEELDNPPTDLIKLVYVNRPGILHTLRTRFMQDHIYTSIGPILVALNPFKWIAGVYEAEVMKTYQSGEANLSDRPHVFAVSNDAYNDLQYGQNQSLIISGESGAGKTEATKQCLSYLAFLAGSASGIQSKILKASPILEAWGNAKTLRNNNSSRFGKFIEIWFDSSCTISGSSNTTYILEKSRVVFQEKDERNYHVFYQLLKGATPELLSELELTEVAATPSIAFYINQSGCIDIENVDDAADFREVNDAFRDVGFSAEDQRSLYTIIAGILHLGNVVYAPQADNPDESVITPESQVWLERAARRFGVETEFIKKALLYKMIRSGNARRTSVAFAPYKLEAAYENKNALAKEIYKRCFDFIVGRINSLMDNDRDQAVNMIGILDIFGFEIFQKNSFEQLCINLANEALQQHFNYNIFQAEMDIYRAEDVPLPPLEYKDNQDVLDLIMKKPMGLIPMLDEEGLVPRGSWEGFLNKYTKQHGKHARYKKSKHAHELGIVHYAGDVCYDATLFLVKNKDTLSADLVDVLSMSELPLLKSFFTEPDETAASGDAGNSGKRPAGGGAQSGAKMTVGRSFSVQLEKLIADLNATKPRYIRCIKPNQVKKPNIFVPDLTNEQLTYSGVFEAVIIMQNGYPFRQPHVRFREQYHMLVCDRSEHQLLFDAEAFQLYAFTSVLPEESTSALQGDDAVPKSKAPRPFTRDQCMFMVRALAAAYPGRDLDGCYPGVTRTFYRAQQHNALVQLRSEVLGRAALTLQTAARAFIARRLCREIRQAESEWFSSLSSRSVEKIYPAAERVDSLVARLNRAVPKIGFELDCTRIGQLYGKAFASEDQLAPAIKAALMEAGDILDKYDRLEAMLKTLDTVNFNVQYRTLTLSFKWEEKKELKDYADQIVAMGKLVKVKRQFRSGIAGRNEVALEQAMRQLTTLQEAGALAGQDSFCVEECVQAQRIITEAEEVFARLLTTVAAAIENGRFTCTATGSLSEEVQISVDASALSAVVADHERDLRSKPADSLPPMRVRALQLLCLQLRDLRLLAKERQWEAVWRELQQNWNLPTEATTEQTERSGFAQSEAFLPESVLSSLTDEKRAISLAAIRNCVVPQVQGAIDRHTVPSVPSLGTGAVLLDTSELSNQIATADAYAAYFDEALDTFIAVAKEHLHYRTEVASGDWTRITALLSRGTPIPATHPDRANVRNFVKMFELVTTLMTRIVEDRVTGEPGAFDFVALQTAGLADACTTAVGMTVNGTAWGQLLTAVNVLRTTRTFLQQELFAEAWDYMQSLSKEAAWQAVASAVAQQSVDPIVAAALSSAVGELKSYELEILHARALKDIAAALAQGGIDDETADYSTSGVSSNALQGELDLRSPQLIPTAAAKQLVDDCKTVIRLRALVLTSQWGEIERVLVPLHEKSEGLKSCHLSCQMELQRCYNRVFDLKVRAQLHAAMAAGHIVVVLGAEGHVCDTEAIDVTALKSAIEFSQEGFILGTTTRATLAEACGLYCLRSALLQDVWEPPERFFFGSTSTANLAGKVALLDSDASLAKARASIPTIIAALNRLAVDAPLESVARAVAQANAKELSVMEVLNHLRRTLPVGSPLQREVTAVATLCSERRCLLLLLLSASTGRVSGSLDDFHTSDVETAHIESALQVVEEQLPSLGVSPVVQNWVQAAKYLLSVRQTIQQAVAQVPEVEPNLSEVFSVQQLQDIISSTTPGFPLQELKLILNKLRDQTSFQELLQALSFGKPVFEEGKVDTYRIQHQHLQERLETAKRNTARSDRLDRLFFYVELTIRLRTAVALGQWELSDRDRANTEGATAMITVKRCLREFEQARRFFSSPIEGVPPESVVGEFTLISREWERRLVKQRFATAFKVGAITGTPLALALTDLRTDLLDGEVARMKEAQSVASEKDESFEQYMRAGNELVTIRREATKVHASYRASVKFAFPSDSLHTILDAQDFIPDAINRALAAVRRCADASSASYRFAEEWDPINNVLANLQGCPAVPATQQEVQLVTAEAQDRAYLANALQIFSAAQSVPSKPRAQQDLIDQLVARQTEYDQLRRERHAAAVAAAKGSGGGRLIFGRRAHNAKQSATLELVHTSAVVLLHYLRALTENTFDPLSRDWREDKNFSKTPRLLTMAQNLDASYSMQQVLRSAQRVVLHPRVQALVHAAAKRLDDAISQQEMLVAFTDAQYVFVGDVDGLKPAVGSVAYMQGVTERIAKVGIEEAVVQKMHAYFTVHQQLRDSIQSRDFERAFAVLDDFLGNGKRDLSFVLQVLSNQNYQVVKEATAEFLLFVAVICDRAWQRLAERAIVQDRIRGRRGALHATTIGWRAIDRALQVLESLPAVSGKSRHLSSLCTLVKGLRRQILGDGAHVVDTEATETGSETGLERLQFAQNRSDLAALAATVVATFAEEVVSTACHRVEGLTAVNLTWAHIDGLSTFSQRHVQPIVDAANGRVDGDLVLSVGYREELLAECDVVNRHCESLQAGMALESALQTTLVFAYSNEGLSMRRDLTGQLMRTYAGATAQRWQLLGHPEEYWWACLTALAKSFQGLMDQASVGGQEVLVLRPGTELFKTLLPTMYALIAQVNNINHQLRASGYRKRQTLPTSILDACDRMRTAIAEHTILARLERIITADRVDMHVTEDTNALKIEVQHVRPVLQIDKDDDLPYGSTYELYGTELKNMILGARVSTTLGKLLIDMLVQLVELRVAIATKRWHIARQRCVAFQWLKEFATCPDIDVCSRFLRYKEYHRAIESAILCCSLPNMLGWSLHTTSREIAQSINDTPLRELLLQGQAKYGNLAVQYLSISQLLALGEQMLTVVNLVRKGLWVGALKYSDEISGGVSGPGTRYVSAECRETPGALRALVTASHTLEGYMKSFVLQTASNLETELTAVQLEHQAQKTLRSARLSGRPGEIVIEENIFVLLQDFGQLTSSSGDLVKRCANLRAADQAAAILAKIVDAHIRGDLPSLTRFVDLLFYLSEIDCSPGTVSPAGFPPASMPSDEELLKLDDALFAHQALAKAVPSILPTIGQGPRATRPDTTRHDALQGYWDCANVESKDELQKTFVRLTGYAFTDAVVLRDEVQDLLSLLHRHLVVVSMHVDYFTATEGNASTSQEPGALDLTLIATDRLAAFREKYARYYASDAVFTPNLGNVMLDLVTSLQTIRQGQLNNDVGMISEGLEQVRAACLREHEYVTIVGSVVFGGTATEGTPYFEHIAEEVELADQDLVQRRLIVSLKEALATRGIPTTHYPFDISGIFVAALEKAYMSCNDVVPACAEARYLYQAASILLVLRKYALRRDWTAMLEFYENLHVEDIEHVFQDASSAAEHVAAKEMMFVSRAVELAIEGYITGHIGGTVGAIAPCGELYLNHKDLRAALDVFDTLNEDWLSPAVMRHFNTTKTLFAIRFNAVARNWDEVLAAADPAMQGLADGSRPLVEICVPEVQLARDHAAYVISLEQARLALQTGVLRGHVGDVHTWQVEIDTLMRSYARLTSINCRRNDILTLKSALEFLFRLRKAILLDQWITPDHTHDYLHLLGSNFHLQDQRTQQRNLYARLVDLSTVPGDATAKISRVVDAADVPVEPVPLTTPGVGGGAAVCDPDRDTQSQSGAAVGTTHTVVAEGGDSVDPPAIAFETVETVLAKWAEYKATNALAAEAVAEVELIYQEMRHRTMASLLLKTIHTPGVQGLPGQVDTSQAVTRLLEKAIFTAVENSDVTLRGDCKGLLRDAKLLLMARRYRINEQWVELHHMLEEIELTLSNEAAAEDAASSEGDGDNSSTSSDEAEHRIPIAREYIRPIVKPVWQELQLLKFDTLFQLYLTNFRHEMIKPSTPPPPPLPTASTEAAPVPPPPGDPSVTDAPAPPKPAAVATEVTQQQVDIIRTILEATEAAAHEYPSPEFARLIEAEAAALELRTFCRENPNKSPQEVIHLVAQTKKRDEDAKQTSYMSLLIHEISQMSHVLDFPINLKTIHREIVKGQKYFACPIGQLEVGLIDMEVITMAYNAAIPSLELFGTEQDQVFMKLAEVVIKLRGALVRNGLNSAILVLDTHGEVLSHPLMRDEVDRLRIEKENHEAGRLMELGLKTGRYIDVLAIARMVHNYERRMAAKQSPAPVVDSHPLANFGPEAKRASRRLQRVSQQVRSSATVLSGSQDDMDNAAYEEGAAHAPRRSRAGAGAAASVGGASTTKAVGDKRRSVQVEEGTVSEEFVEGVFKSINALNRAIAIADQVRVRSANTEFYLNGVHVILRLRELTVSDNWDEVKRYVNDEANWQNLPNTALEEIRACREGLLYQQHVVRMSQALCQGAIGGLPHELEYDQISCDALIASLRACDEVQFTDPSAQLLIEFAQRIVTVRHLLLTDQWLDEGAATKPDAALALETPSKLRKSIYSHPAPKKVHALRETVETSVQEYIEFFAHAVPKLQRRLRVASQIDEDADLDFASLLQEARLQLGYYGSAGSSPRGSVARDPDGWILQIWQAVMHVVLEVHLTQQVIQYRTVLIHLIEAADATPDMVRAYVLDRAHLHANVHPLLRSSHHHEDITLYGAGSASNLGSYAVGGSINFDTTALEDSLQRAKDYLSHVGFETSEEMLKLQETCKLLIDFRSALNAQEAHTALLQLHARAKALSVKGFLSTESGVFEINAYLASTAESERIQRGLQVALQSHGVRGPLNALDRAAVDASELQRMIDDALRYLARGGAALSVGVPTLLLQARVIHKLRTSFVDHSWSALEYTLKTYGTQAADWDAARDEFRHIQHAFAFRTAMNHIRKFVADFTSEKDLGHSLMCLEVDLRELNGIFVEVNRLLHYHSLLLVSGPDARRNPEEAVEAPEVVLTDAFFKHPSVVATVALWKLCQALQVNAWYDKQAIHDNEEQQIADQPDPFLFAFFGLANANYVHRVRSGLVPSDITEGFMLSNLARKETVFSVLTATNWSAFPYNIRMFFNRVRNRLIDRYIRADLKYYCKKGATAMDGAGNLVLSNMTLQFLKIALADAQRAVDMARRCGIPFEWTVETKKWVSSAETALKYRQALTTSSAAADTVISLLRADGLMRGHTQFVPRLFSIHTELEVLEKFGQAHVAERVAAAALQFIANQPVASESRFSEVALDNEAVLQVFEMAAAPVPVAEPSAYLLDMLAIVSLTRDAIFATMLGGEVRLAFIAEDLIEAVAFHHSPALRAIDMPRVVKFLTAACRKAYHADLLGFPAADNTTQAAPQRRVARVHTVLGTRATARYLGPGAIGPPTPTKGPPTAVGRVFPSPHVLDEEQTGVGKLAVFTQKILTALCEVLYFHRGDDHITVGTKAEWLDQLRKRVPMGPRSQAPVHCYLSLRKLADGMDQLYVAYQPLWAATLHLVLYYLERELGDEAFQGDASAINVAQLIYLSQDLIQLCQDVQLDRAVLAEYLRDTAQPRRRHGRPVPARVVGGDVAPSAFVLVKHLTSIRTTAHNDGQAEAGAVAKLRSRLQGMVDCATEAQSHMASLSLENEVVGALSEAQVTVLKELPLGAGQQAVSQCNMLLRAAL